MASCSLNSEQQNSSDSISSDSISSDSNSSNSSENEHAHSFSDAYSYDDTYHWHECSGCNEIADKAEHVFGDWIVDKQPTEKEKGERHKDCTVCDYSIHEEMDKLEHVHKAGEAVEENIVPATCLTDGSYYLVTYCVDCENELSREFNIVPALGHDWDAASYTWNADYSKCTAERMCKRDNSHEESEVVNSTYSVLNDPTCEEDSIVRYSAVFANSVFETQNKDIVIEPATGHLYGQPTYEWDSDYSSCIARRICQNDPSHVESETISSKYQIITPAGVSTDGLGRYIAAFKNYAFEQQTHDIVIYATGSIDKLTFVLAYDETSYEV